MKAQLDTLISQALSTLKSQGLLPADFQPAIQLERTKDRAHGDWATNIALMSAKAASRKPREIADALVAALPAAASRPRSGWLLRCCWRCWPASVCIRC